MLLDDDFPPWAFVVVVTTLLVCDPMLDFRGMGSLIPLCQPCSASKNCVADPKVWPGITAEKQATHSSLAVIF